MCYDQETKQEVMDTLAEENDQLRAENKRQSKELAEQSIKLMVFNEVAADKNKAIELLRAILSEHGDNSESMASADRWMLDNVNTNSPQRHGV